MMKEFNIFKALKNFFFSKIGFPFLPSFLILKLGLKGASLSYLNFYTYVKHSLRGTNLLLVLFI